MRWRENGIRPQEARLVHETMYYSRSISRKMYGYVLIAISTHTHVCMFAWPYSLVYLLRARKRVVIERFVFVSISATIMKACPPDL